MGVYHGTIMRRCMYFNKPLSNNNVKQLLYSEYITARKWFAIAESTIGNVLKYCKPISSIVNTPFGTTAYGNGCITLVHWPGFLGLEKVHKNTCKLMVWEESSYHLYI